MLKCKQCGGDLTSKRSKKFCGNSCYREWLSENIKYRNIGGRKYHEVLEDHGDWIVLDISTDKNPSATMKIDKKDHRMFSFGVFLDKKGYCSKKINGVSRKVHRHICPDEWKMVDHINRDKSDNRRRNLRETTPSLNAINSKLNKNNKSGVSGVCFHKVSGKWIAKISSNGKKIHLGLFDDKKDAIKARRQAEIDVYGYMLKY